MDAVLWARFWNRVLVGDGCWEWTGPRWRGYGKAGIPINGRQTTVRAHRYAYEQLVGPIPEGMQLDHLCRNRACVRPDHLEAVSPRENTLRGLASRGRITHCKRGHEFDAVNTGYESSGGRRCKACDSIKHRRYRAERRAKRNDLASTNHSRKEAA